MRTLATNSTGILSTVGKTPLVPLKRLYPEYNFQLFGKLECFNPGGSIKDRTALQIVSQALAQGDLQRGDTVIESSSGNMAIGLAQTCLYHGLKLVVVVDPNVNKQNVRILKAYGATIEYVREPALVGGYLTARLQRVQELLDRIPGSFWTNQYGNPQNPYAHHQTLAEIMEVLQYQVDYIFIATSTCGTLAGCAQYLKKNRLKTKIVAVDAVGSVIFNQPAGKRYIPGHGAGRPSQFLRAGMVADAVHVTDLESVQGCRKLLSKEAILCGGSSGAIVSAFEKYQARIPDYATCVFLLCDRGERYLDTIYNDQWVHQYLIQPQEKAIRV